MKKLFVTWHDVLAFTVIVLFAVSVLSGVYSIFGGIWGFNPTSIAGFNFKLFISSLISAIVWFHVMGLLVD